MHAFAAYSAIFFEKGKRMSTIGSVASKSAIEAVYQRIRL